MLATAAASGEAVTSKDIVARMAFRYASMKSYQDTGVVVIPSSDDEAPRELPFKTFFVRPHRFRFEWVHSHPYSGLRHHTRLRVLWANDSGMHTFYEKTGGLGKSASLANAIAGATGVSYGSAHNVPRLLNLADGLSLADMTELSPVDRADFENTPCFRVRGKSPSDGSVFEMWIGEDFLLRKVRTHFTTKPVDEIHRMIEVDKEIPEAIFHFEPPSEP
jgi:hypothetical protein